MTSPINFDDKVRVASLNQQQMSEVKRTEDENASKLSSSIQESEDILLSLGIALPEEHMPSESKSLRPVILTRSWDALLAEAQESVPNAVDFTAFLSQDEINAVLKNHASIGRELDWLSSLDRYELSLSVVVGIISGVVDVLLVGIPAHPGFMGSPKSEGGWLSNSVKEKVSNLFPPDKISELEKAYKVSYDPSTSRSLHKKVAGLGPGTHRFQSLGHDPLLGFIFGIKDILTGKFTAISKDGFLITQKVADPLMIGENLFVRLVEAIAIQLGHLASDVATSRGLPAPLMPLLEFLQFGKIGNKEYTIGEVARQMYRSGYDSRHFMAASIPVMITEIIIRLSYVIRAIKDGKSLVEAIPSASSIKLRRQLLIAHSVSTLINAGKVYVTQNPLAISWPQTLAFLRYVLPELHFLLYGKEAARSKMVEDEILNSYHSIDCQLNEYLKNQNDFVLVV